MTFSPQALIVPGQTTIGTIRTLAMQEADQLYAPLDANSVTGAGPTFIGLTEINNYINLETEELQGDLIELMQDYYVAPIPYLFSTDGTNDMYALPTDFFKSLGVDQIVTPGIPQSTITLKQFAYGERNRYNVPYYPILPGLTNLRYRISGNNLWLIPSPPQANQQIRVRYIPRSSPLYDQGTLTLNTIAAGDTIAVTTIIAGVTTTTTFTGYAGTPTFPQFLIGGTDTITATNLAASMNGTFNPNYLSATAVGTQVFLNLLVPMQVSWTAVAAFQFGWFLSPNPTVTQSNPTQLWTNVLDGVNGWEEQVVLGVAIRILTKEESDSSALERRKAAIKHRMESEASNRDMGMPAHVVDVPDYDGLSGGGMGGWPGGW